MCFLSESTDNVQHQNETSNLIRQEAFSQLEHPKSSWFVGFTISSNLYIGIAEQPTNKMCSHMLSEVLEFAKNRRSDKREKRNRLAFPFEG